MVQSSSASRLGLEFDDFLFAPIGEDKNGMLLRVVSALARLDLDPWQEAANLAHLPTGTATERLAALISALPDVFTVHQDSAAIASRLIARLPCRPGSSSLAAKKSSGNRNPTEIQSQTFLYIAFLLVVLLGSLGFMGNPQSAAYSNNAPAPTASEIIP